MFDDHIYVEYVGDNIFKVMVTKFLYYSFDDYGGFKIDKPDDLINLDLSREYIIYHKNNFYFAKYGTFDKDYFCRCQQGSIKLYSIEIIDNKLHFTELNDELITLFDLDYSEPKFETIREGKRMIKHELTEEKKKRKAIYSLIEKLYYQGKDNYMKARKEQPLEDAPIIDHPIYELLIKPFLNKPLYEPYHETMIINNQKFKTEYKIIFWHFLYDNDSPYVHFNREFDLSLVEGYVLKSDKYEYLYLKSYPPYKKDVLYRRLNFFAMCCGSGNYFFYHIKSKRWIDQTEEELKKRESIYCTKCDKKLEKYEKVENTICFNCY